ncbi:MAG: hypothetical protein WBW84_13585 [Acidobacteriaceae bacterium]
MAAHRKHPPNGAAETIEGLAGKGHSTIGVAKHFNVACSTVKRWFTEDQDLQDAYDKGRDSYRQALEEQIVAMGLAGKNCGGLIFLMKAKFGLFDVPQSGTKVDVAVNVPQPVLLVRDFGDDKEWAAKVAEQQRKLCAGENMPAIPARLPVPQNALQEPAGPVSYTARSSALVPVLAPSYARPWNPES